MSDENETNENETAAGPVPSREPLKHEPTPERAREEKKKQEEQAEQVAEIAKPKPSGAV